MTHPEASLDLFHPQIKRWFLSVIGNPTSIQQQAWKSIAQGKHVLVSAPTGTGKTLTAFLWGLNQIITGTWSTGRTRILYVSPLKALNNDIQKNLLRPLSELEQCFRSQQLRFPHIDVFTRSGDTSSAERRKMAKNPPEILITTPESLNIILSSKRNRYILSGLATVILDEIHALVGGKRGSHLITAVDRLVPLCGEFQRIALSATVNPMEEVARFVGGYQLAIQGNHYSYTPRAVETIKADDAKTYDVRVNLPLKVVDKTEKDSWMPELIAELYEQIVEHQSTLIFTNNRRNAEKIARYLNDKAHVPLAYAHHGSLSREIRLTVEDKLKQGELRAIAATNSLELGIDVGELDQVILVEAPLSIASAIQRIGRAGHQVGAISKGRMYPLHAHDFIHAAVLTQCIQDRDIEQVHPIQNPLDILTQVILSMTLVESWQVDELYHFIRTSYPFHTLKQTQFNLVLKMMAGFYADTRIRDLRPMIHLDATTQTVKARPGMGYVLFSSGGTIPDRGYYNLRLQDGKTKIGELDEEFVWERNLGETFALGTQIWTIQRITSNDVEVLPGKRTGGMIPFWKAEEQYRDFHYAKRIGSFLARANSQLDSPAFRTELTEVHNMIPEAADTLLDYLKRQKEQSGVDLPHRNHLVVEIFQDGLNTGETDIVQLILHTLWGGRVNRPLALAIAARWEQRYATTLEVFSNDDCLLLVLPEKINLSELLSLLEPEDIEHSLRSKLETTGFFGARFRENAGRALLLPRGSFNKRIPFWMTRVRSKKLLERVLAYDDFPLIYETWRTCLHDVFDLPNLRQVLQEVQDGIIQISEVTSGIPSPFAAAILYAQTNQYMYEDDTPQGGSLSNLTDSIFNDLLHSDSLRPQVSKDIILQVQKKIQRLAPGYAPATTDDLLDWIKERLLIPYDEWMALVDHLQDDYDIEANTFIQEVCPKLVHFAFPNNSPTHIAALETLPYTLECMGIPFKKELINPLKSCTTIKKDTMVETLNQLYSQRKSEMNQEDDNEKGSEPASFSSWLYQWLSYYGILTLKEINAYLGVPKSQLENALIELGEERHILVGQLSENAVQIEYCVAENFEFMLRVARKQRRAPIEAREAVELPLYLASHQGICTPGDSPDDLQFRLDQLLGYPAPVESWEQDIFPARIQPYYSTWLDNLMLHTGLYWIGCGPKKIAFQLEGETTRIPACAQSPNDSLSLEVVFPHPTGRYEITELVQRTLVPMKTMVQWLWDTAWGGLVTNDSFEALRKGIQTHFSIETVEDQMKAGKRLSLRRWNAAKPLPGHWYPLNSQKKSEPDDIIALQEREKDRVRQLLHRYGILFRDILHQEAPENKWGKLIRTLYLMELSGELISGYFFKGIHGPQFITTEGLLRFQQLEESDSVWWLNATDPASLCGLKIEGLDLPRRVASNYLVYHGSRLVMELMRSGAHLVIHVVPDNPSIDRYFQVFKVLLNRAFGAPKSIEIKTINDDTSLKSPFKIPLKAFGFSESYKGLILQKTYY